MKNKKNHGPAPVPPGNRPLAGAGKEAEEGVQTGVDPNSGAPFEEQDPKRRLGNFSGAGEHAYQQPGGRNDANR